MSVLVNDAGFRWTESGQDYQHFLGANLGLVSPARVQNVASWQSADLTTIRRISIGSGVDDITATIRFDGDPHSLLEFLAAGRRGASLEYFPSFANPSESFPCILVDAADPVPDPDMGWDKRYSAQVRLRRIDGGNWLGVTAGSLFYYTAGNPLPGLTFSRTGTAKYVDELGVIQEAAENIFRTDWVGSVPYLLLEAARTNLVSNDDLSTWNSLGGGTPVVTGSIDDPAGGTDAYTVEDDGGTVEAKLWDITFTGNGVKSGVFVVRENEMASSGNQSLRIRDTTAAVDRFRASITGWTDGEPQITEVTGSVPAVRYIGNGYWEIDYETVAVTAANTNRAEIYPAETAAATGSIDVYRVNAFDALTPAHPVADASDVLGAELLTADYVHSPQLMSVYQKFRVLTPNPAGVGFLRTFELGDTDTANSGGLGILYNDSVAHALIAKARFGSGSADFVQAGLTVSGGFVVGDILELLVVYDPVGETLRLDVSKNGAAVQTASVAVTPIESFSHQAIAIGADRSGSSHAGNHYASMKVLPRDVTMAEARAA